MFPNIRCELRTVYSIARCGFICICRQTIQITIFLFLFQSPSHGEFSFDGSLLNYGSLTNDQGVQTGSAAHRRAWEAGHVDYHGRDSFTNIQEQLERNIAHQPQQYHPSQQRQTTPPQFVFLLFLFINSNRFFLSIQINICFC